MLQDFDSLGKYEIFLLNLQQSKHNHIKYPCDWTGIFPNIEVLRRKPGNQTKNSSTSFFTISVKRLISPSSCYSFPFLSPLCLLSLPPPPSSSSSYSFSQSLSTNSSHSCSLSSTLSFLNQYRSKFLNFGTNEILDCVCFVVEADLHIVKCLAAFLASIHQMPGANLLL